MKRERKSKELPLWRKTSPGTLIFKGNIRIKPKQEIQCAVEDLGRFALSDFEILDSGTGKFKVTKSIIEDAVKKAEEGMVKKGKNKGREVIKLKDLLPKTPEEVEVKSSKQVKGDEEYFIEHKGAGKYIVLSSSGKQMNTHLLEKKEAKQLKKSLES